MTSNDTALVKAAGLSCWKTKVSPRSIGGGITNLNFAVEDDGEMFFVRIGEDIALHHIMRFNELAASRAAYAAGLSPEVVHAERGALVLRFIAGRTFAEEDVRDDRNLPRVINLVKRCHREVPKHLRGAVLCFWVFHILRDYAATLATGGSRLSAELPRYLAVARELEAAVGPIELVFGHNDLLPANFMDDGKRLWLIDWDYAGFTSGLFDLGGLASNNRLSAAQEEFMLESYFDARVTDELRRRYQAMKCASLLRESMWSMVSEIHSTLDVDYVAYTSENLRRFEAALEDFRDL
jgi:thiamine kinase-like enzyme